MEKYISQSDRVKKVNLLAFMSIALMHTQMTEKIISQTLLYVIQEGEGLDLEALERQVNYLDRKTLGQMIKILKKRIGIDDNLERLMIRFLENRNILAHDLQRIEGYDLDTHAGRSVLNVFLEQVVDDATRLQKIFTSIGFSWQEQVGFVTPVDEEVRKFVGEEFINFSEYLFYNKKDEK